MLRVVLQSSNDSFTSHFNKVFSAVSKGCPIIPYSRNEILVSLEMSPSQFLLKPSCLKIMQKGYILSDYLGTCPFHWNELKQGPQTVHNPLKKILWSINALLSFAQATFAVAQCWRTTQNDRAAPAHKIYIQFGAVLYTFGVLLHLANFCNRRFLPRFVRSYIKVFEDLQRKLLLQ